eukprot:Em0001g2767a
MTPAPSSIVQRFKFFCRSQQDSESVSQFVAELRKLSEFCEFGDTLDVMLRDRLVCGVRNQKLQQRLLAESNLTFTKAFGIAQTAELSEQNAKDLQREETMEVHVLNKKGRKEQCRLVVIVSVVMVITLRLSVVSGCVLSSFVIHLLFISLTRSFHHSFPVQLVDLALSLKQCPLD